MEKCSKRGEDCGFSRFFIESDSIDTYARTLAWRLRCGKSARPFYVQATSAGANLAENPVFQRESLQEFGGGQTFAAGFLQFGQAHYAIAASHDNTGLCVGIPNLTRGEPGRLAPRFGPPH